MEPCQISKIEHFEKKLTSNLWNKYDSFNVGLVFTPEVFLQCKKAWGPGLMGQDHEFWYTFPKFYRGITYSFWLSTFSNLSTISWSIHNRINSLRISYANKTPLKRRSCLWHLKWNKNSNIMWKEKYIFKNKQFFLYEVL